MAIDFIWHGVTPGFPASTWLHAPLRLAHSCSSPAPPHGSPKNVLTRAYESTMTISLACTAQGPAPEGTLF